MRPPGRFHRSRNLWQMVIAPIIWSLHFVAVYGFTAVACAKAGDAALARGGVAALTLVALAAILFVGWRAWRQWDYLDDFDYDHGGQSDEDRREFLGHVGVLLAAISGIGVIYVALPAVFIGSCL